MLSLSQTTGYAIKALACLDGPACRCQKTGAIAECAGVPRHYLVKVFLALARSGIVNAVRGSRGGIWLSRPPEKISLLEIVEAVEGEKWLGDCLLGMDECSSERICPTHDFWQRIRREIRDELGKATLASVLTFKQNRRCRTAKKLSLRGLDAPSLHPQGVLS